MVTIHYQPFPIYRKNTADFTTNRDRKDLAIMNNFELKVNLSEVFNWNVKEIFLYLTAEYASDVNVSNQ